MDHYYGVIRDKDDSLKHFGMPRRSGRYKWGSGDRPYQGDNITNTGNDTNKNQHTKNYEVKRKTSETDGEKNKSTRETYIDNQINNTEIKKANMGEYSWMEMNVQEYAGAPKVKVFGSDITESELKTGAKNFLMNQRDITRLCKEAVMEDDLLYEIWIKDRGLSKDQFKNAIDIKSVSIYDDKTAGISMWEKNDNDALLGGHSLDMEINLKEPRKPSYVSMNG